MFTWPYSTVLCTGSRTSATGSSHHMLSRGPAGSGPDDRERVNSRNVTPVSAMLASVTTMAATVIGTMASGDSSTAAKGG